MVRKIINVLVVLPLAILFVIFAVANRHFVTVSFDPFNASDPALSLTTPLFVVIIAAAVCGVAAGGIATWFGQRRWRKAARQHESEARAARAQLADLRLQAPVAGAGVPAPQYAAIGRDKPGATL